jgi:hypothetical protein
LPARVTDLSAVRYADGSFGVVCDDVFRETCAAAPGEGRWPPPD